VDSLLTRKERTVVGMMTTPTGKLRLNKCHKGTKRTLED
jgi:hypothetical protein